MTKRRLFVAARGLTPATDPELVMHKPRTPLCQSTRHSGCSNQKRRGATLVEFAVISPLLFLVIFLFVEFDRYVVTVHALKEAVRVGTRLAVLEGTTLEDVEAEVATILTPFGVDNYTTTVTPDLLTSIDAGDPVSVKVDVAYDDVAWLPTPKYLGGKMISVTSTSPKER